MNAQVEKALPEHTARMIKYIEPICSDISKAIIDGYFFSKFFISAENNLLLIDLRKKTISKSSTTNEDFSKLNLKTA